MLYVVFSVGHARRTSLQSTLVSIFLSRFSTFYIFGTLNIFYLLVTNILPDLFYISFAKDLLSFIINLRYIWMVVHICLFTIFCGIDIDRPPSAVIIRHPHCCSNSSICIFQRVHRPATRARARMAYTVQAPFFWALFFYVQGRPGKRKQAVVDVHDDMA